MNNINTNFLNDVKHRFLPLPRNATEEYEHEPNITDFETKRELGIGSYGKVYLVTHRKTKAEYALKIIDKLDSLNQKEKNYFNRELEIMYKLNHPNIVKLYSHFEDNNFCYLLMQYIPNGSSYQLIPKNGKKQENLQIVASVMKDLICAIYYLHNMKPKIIHRDIKPENILLDENNNAYLTDFGWSNYIINDRRRNTICGTPFYLPPEMVNEKGHDETADIWCLGVLLFELTNGKVPFEGKDVEEVGNNIINMNIKWSPDVNPDAKDLISKILRSNPNERLTLEQILSHKFFKNYFPNAVDDLIKPHNTKYKIFVVSKDNPKTWESTKTRGSIFQNNIITNNLNKNNSIKKTHTMFDYKFSNPLSPSKKENNNNNNNNIINNNANNNNQNNTSNNNNNTINHTKTINNNNDKINHTNTITTNKNNYINHTNSINTNNINNTSNINTNNISNIKHTNSKITNNLTGIKRANTNSYTNNMKFNIHSNNISNNITNINSNSHSNNIATNNDNLSTQTKDLNNINKNTHFINRSKTNIINNADQFKKNKTNHLSNNNSRNASNIAKYNNNNINKNNNRNIYLNNNSNSKNDLHQEKNYSSNKLYSSGIENDKFSLLLKNYTQLKKEYESWKNRELGKLANELKSLDKKIINFVVQKKTSEHSIKKNDSKNLKNRYEQLKSENEELKEKITKFSKLLKNIDYNSPKKSKKNLDIYSEIPKKDLDQNTQRIVNDIIEQKENQVNNYKDGIKRRIKEEKERFAQLINKYDRTLISQERENKELKIKLMELESQFN